MSAPKIGAVVLAAGASTRMGEPKQSLEVDGESLLSRAIRAAFAAHCSPVVVVLGANADAFVDEVDRTGARFVVNTEWAEGMGGSIACGVAALETAEPDGLDGILISLCDQPLVDAAALGALVDAFASERPSLVASEYAMPRKPSRAGSTDAEIARASADRRQPDGTILGVPAIFGRSLFAELRALAGPRGARAVVERHAADAVRVPNPLAAFDVDTPDDLRAIRERPTSRRD